MRFSDGYTSRSTDVKIENNRQKIRRTSAASAPLERRASVVAKESNFRKGLPKDHSSSGYASGGNPSIQPLIIPSPANVPQFNGVAVQTPTAHVHSASTMQSPFSSHPSSSPTTATSNSVAFNADSARALLNSGPPSAPPNITQFSDGAYPFTTLPQPAHPHTYTTHQLTATTHPGQSYSSHEATTSMDGIPIATTSGGMDIETSMGAPYTMPVFGGNDAYNRSPHWGGMVSTEWFEYLLGADAGGQPTGQPKPDGPGNGYFDNTMNGQEFYFNGNQGTAFGSTFFNGPPLNTHPMNISTIAPPSPPRESLLSLEKRKCLLEVVDQFQEIQSGFPGGLAADHDDDDRHVFSLVMLQQYIQLYWAHFHPQLPILHRPTFSAEKTPNLQLLCIIVIGAACMDWKEDPVQAKAAADLAKLIARNIRWTLFSDEDFRPPAKLWVFQALLLLETYEKMYSDRKLHERAHIHHATTLTLMRRGSSLTGRSGAFDSPQSGRDAKSVSDGSSVTFSGQPGAGTSNTSDEHWNRWIIQEATKRVAFAAFVLDATHATMFGHSAVMVAHEMRLQLPCDETLWAATNWNGVFSIQQSLTQNNVRTPTFVEGLRETLSGRSVATNSFGRTILMAGLLSVGWHLHQRDLQIQSLGVAQQVGGAKWRATLIRSFDHWKKDYDMNMDKLSPRNRPFETLPYYASQDVEHENIFESRTVLHHLAHMSMHVDIVDLQIYAGSRKLLGRAITRHEAENTRKRMASWAPSARARDATFYALQFLSRVLLPEETRGVHFSENEDEQSPTPTSSRTIPPTSTGVPVYNARDDHLLNRPWVLYYACLVVWSYGYALEGPLQQPVVPEKLEDIYAAMRAYLKASKRLNAPEELGSMTGKNSCLGLLLTLKHMFKECRWELLKEANLRLENCVRILTGELPN